MEPDKLDESAAEVAAMQFAGGMSIAHVAELWEKDRDWVEEAIRQMMLRSIPRRDGGTKMSRVEARAANAEAVAAWRASQGTLEW